MVNTELTINFNLKNARDMRIYRAIKNLPEYFGERDLSEVFIKFLDILFLTVVENEEKLEKYEKVLNDYSKNKVLN